MKRYLELIVAATALVIVAVTIAAVFRLVDKSQLQQASLDREFKEADSATVADVQQRLKAHLSALPTDDPIVDRFGSFVAIEGRGYSRSGDPLENRPITMNRQIKFQNATVPCLITVSARGTLKFDVEIASADSRDSRKNVASGPPKMVVAVTHPRYIVNTSVFRDTIETTNSLDDIFETFVQGVVADDRQRLSTVRQWYDAQRKEKPTAAFVRRALVHPDEAVRLKAVEFLSTPLDGTKVHFSDSMMGELLIAVEDRDQPVTVRRELVFAILQGYENDRAELYDLLRQAGDEGLFAVKPIAQFMVDRSHRHWRNGGDFDAPIGAAELLQEWGPDASEAVPALIEVLREHPNQYSFAPAAAVALGAMGPEASEAVDALELATTARYGDVREAATEALNRISTSRASRFGRPLQFLTTEDREQFYPLKANRLFSWLSADRDSLMFLRTDGEKPSLHKVDLETAECKHLIDLDATGIQSAVGIGDQFIVLRLEDTNGKKTLFADTWSLNRLKRIKITTLAFLQPVNPNQKSLVDHIVWSDDRSKVAFVQSVRTPRDRGYTERRVLQVKSLDQPNPYPDDRPDEYLMVPIGFNSTNDSLILEGWCFQEKVNGIASMNLSTRDVEFLSPNEKSLTTLSRHRGAHDWIVVGYRSNRNGSTIKLLDPSTQSTREFVAEHGLAYMDQPWEPAVAFDASGRLMAVATRNGVDVFDTETRQRVSRHVLTLSGSPYKLRPLVFAADHRGFVLATVKGIPHSDPSTKNDLHLIRISADQ
ncbi:HEAT repeat domain-containing protein [Rhodopirellula sp. JC639]|uniref:HEAT repeat domain-containing protein n=1 Tax=Stieleria mannarensis TaxID=2755585 RepID=UPI0016009B38|nr:HEAT repeat domain-containing protein [Rhodopirellula sp. JC639]